MSNIFSDKDFTTEQSVSMPNIKIINIKDNLYGGANNLSATSANNFSATSANNLSQVNENDINNLISMLTSETNNELTSEAPKQTGGSNNELYKDLSTEQLQQRLNQLIKDPLQKGGDLLTMGATAAAGFAAAKLYDRLVTTELHNLPSVSETEDQSVKFTKLGPIKEEDGIFIQSKYSTKSPNGSLETTTIAPEVYSVKINEVIKKPVATPLATPLATPVAATPVATPVAATPVATPAPEASKGGLLSLFGGGDDEDELRSEFYKQFGGKGMNEGMKKYRELSNHILEQLGLTFNKNIAKLVGSVWREGKAAAGEGSDPAKVLKLAMEYFKDNKEKIKKEAEKIMNEMKK